MALFDHTHPDAQHMKVVDSKGLSQEHRYIIAIDPVAGWIDEVEMVGPLPKLDKDGKPIVNRIYGSFKLIDKRTNLEFK